VEERSAGGLGTCLLTPVPVLALLRDKVALASGDTAASPPAVFPCVDPSHCDEQVLMSSLPECGHRTPPGHGNANVRFFQDRRRPVAYRKVEELLAPVMGAEDIRQTNASPSTQLMQLLWPGGVAVQAIHVAAKLGLADLVARSELFSDSSNLYTRPLYPRESACLRRLAIKTPQRSPMSRPPRAHPRSS
jgi:hypothetical protein